MSRPHIVRADTMDLQDTMDPTQKHSPSLTPSGLAPHQAAEVHHVMEERNSEEQSLADAWNITTDLSDEPDAIQQAQAQVQANSEANGAHDDEDGGEVDTDDDMMDDRISSSPSIDDGGSPSQQAHTTPQMAVWPVRSASLSPSPIPLRADFNSSASSPSTLESSPFLRTPEHMPLRGGSVTKEGSPLSRTMYGVYSSPFDESPISSPPVASHNVSFPSHLSNHHHQMGRYGYDLEPELEAKKIGDELCYGETANIGAGSKPGEADVAGDSGADKCVVVYRDRRPIESPFRIPAFTHSMTGLDIPNFGPLEQSPSLISIASVDMADVLLPLNDPLLDTPLPSPSSDDSWEDASDSETESWDPDGETGHHDDDAKNIFLDLDNRFIDSGWGGECLRETEDIDFEFVYALHTFVATVEGQANATKGDTMVLLDDSNSYWWLVRVVKDSSIGYLPAEHIETPTERLARLNKHRNIDLSATMLSDNSEKTRNPLKKAMRRRNAKTVQFAAPTYVEASDYDYSSDEDDQPMIDPYAAVIANTDAEQTGPEADKEQQHNGDQGHAEDAEDGKASNPSRGSFDREQAATAAIDEPELSPRLVDKTEAAPLKSRKGTPRNTDSFLKDDSIETRKITLTPGILREDAASIKSASSESARNPSMEILDKQSSPQEVQFKKEVKDKKKETKKGGGMLSGLFKSKKKDKKSKEDGHEQGDEKLSTELSRDSPHQSGSSSPVDRNGAIVVSNAEIKQPQPLMLQPPPKGKLSKNGSPTGTGPVRDQQEEEENKHFVAELPGAEVAHEMAAGNVLVVPAPTPEHKESALSPLTNMLRPNSAKDPKPTKAKRSKQRVELDDFDSTPEEEGPNPFKEQADRERSRSEDGGERLSESPIEITSPSTGTFMHGTEIIHIPTPGTADRPDGKPDDDGSESLSSSPDIVERPAKPPSPTSDEQQDNDPTPTAPRSPQPLNSTTTQSAAGLQLRSDSISASTENSSSSSSHLSPSSAATTTTAQSWSDSSLRAWLEDGSEVKDMLVMIHDKSGVVPVSADHPMMAGLYVEPRKGVQDLMGQLDGLLGGYLQRRGISLP